MLSLRRATLGSSVTRRISDLKQRTQAYSTTLVTRNTPAGHSSKAPTQRPAAMAAQQGTNNVDGSTQKKKLVLVVGVALIEKGEQGSKPRVLLAQRPAGKANAGLWEFPGGKVDEGETPEDALVRELQEELGLQVRPESLRPLSFVSWPYPSFHLLMPLYECREWQGKPHGVEGQAIVWASKEELAKYELTPADVPLVPDVLRALQG